MGVFDGFNLAGTAANSLGSLIGGGISSIFANRQRKKNVQAQKELMDYQAEINQNNILNGARWQKESLQRAGLSTAGMNGQFNAATASIPGAAGATNVDTKSPFAFEAIQAAKDAHNVALSQQQKNEAETKVLDEQAKSIGIENQYKGQSFEDEHEFKRELIGKTKAETDEIFARAANLDADTIKLRRESDLVIKQIEGQELSNQNQRVYNALQPLLLNANLRVLFAQAYQYYTSGQKNLSDIDVNVQKVLNMQQEVHESIARENIDREQLNVVIAMAASGATESEILSATKNWKKAGVYIDTIVHPICELVSAAGNLTKFGQIGNTVASFFSSASSAVKGNSSSSPSPSGNPKPKRTVTKTSYY